MLEIESYRILIPILVLASHLAVSWRSRTAWNPVSMTILWWGGWLWVATFSFTGIFLPSERAIICTMVFLMGLTIGPWFARRPPSDEVPFVAKPAHEEQFVRKFAKAFPWLLGATAAMVVPPFVRALIGLANYKSYIFKAEAFGTPDRPGLIFRSNLLESLYFTLSGPLLLALLVFGMALYFTTGRKRELVAGVIFNVLDAIMRLGRVNIYMVCLFIALGTAMMFGVRKANKALVRPLLKRIAGIAVVAAVLLVLILQIGFARQGTRTGYLTDHFRVYVIEYHTIGFALFDSKVKDPESDLNRKLTYGRLTLGGLESLVTVVIRRFTRDYNSPALENAVKMTQDAVVGVESVDGKQFPKSFNSYYTILYTFYSDGRLVGMFLGGLMLGYLLAAFYAAWRTTGAIEPLTWIFFILSVGIFGIFVSTLELMRTWMMAMGLIALHFWAREKSPRSQPEIV
jgi:oligosaccharide repeat unit polymerase